MRIDKFLRSAVTGGELWLMRPAQRESHNKRPHCKTRTEVNVGDIVVFDLAILPELKVRK